MITELEHRERQIVADENYNSGNNILKPVLGYIVEKYKNETADAMSAVDDMLRKYMGKFILLGFDTLYLATELFQWDYDVYMVVESKSLQKRVLKAAQDLAFFPKEVLVYNFYKDIPQARVCVASDKLQAIVQDSDKYKWLDLVTSRCEELILAENEGVLESLRLSERYKVNHIKSSNANSYLSLEKKQ